jgi:MarR family transcriptional regulator, organic hydroperoxide resistance regulator
MTLDSELSAQPSSIHARDLESLLAAAVKRAHPELDQLVLKASTNLKRSFNILSQEEAREMHPSSGRTAAAFRVLVMVWAFGPIEAKDVARLSGVSRQAVSGVLSSLERDGLVTRERATKADRRLAPITISPEGAELVEEHLAPQNNAQRAFFSTLTRGELRTLVDLLAKVIVGHHG